MKAVPNILEIDAHEAIPRDRQEQRCNDQLNASWLRERDMKRTLRHQELRRTVPDADKHRHALTAREVPNQLFGTSQRPTISLIGDDDVSLVDMGLNRGTPTDMVVRLGEPDGVRTKAAQQLWQPIHQTVHAEPNHNPTRIDVWEVDFEGCNGHALPLRDRWENQAPLGPTTPTFSCGVRARASSGHW
jgi:hypothetical protein